MILRPTGRAAGVLGGLHVVSFMPRASELSSPHQHTCGVGESPSLSTPLTALSHQPVLSLSFGTNRQNAKTPKEGEESWGCLVRCGRRCVPRSASSARTTQRRFTTLEQRDLAGTAVPRSLAPLPLPAFWRFKLSGSARAGTSLPCEVRCGCAPRRVSRSASSAPSGLRPRRFLRFT